MLLVGLGFCDWGDVTSSCMRLTTNCRLSVKYRSARHNIVCIIAVQLVMNF